MTMLIGLRDGLRGQPSTVALRQADTLVLFTDGVIEAGHDIIAGLAAIRAAATPGLRSAADLRRHVIPQGSSDDAAILVVRTDYAEAERHITRWNFDLFDQAEATAVRHHFVHSLSRVGFSADECSSAELVFGELIGNVVRHAPNSRRADVVVDHSGPQSVLHVLDRGAGFYHIGRLPRDPYAEHGRGLFLIGALSSDFTVSERPDGGSHARVVLRGGSAPRLTRPASARSAMPTHS
jgi:anti-sigma regulatory factor (Ser/Thr protein kinase)